MALEFARARFALFGLALLCSYPVGAAAQTDAGNFPNRPIKIVIPKNFCTI